MDYSLRRNFGLYWLAFVALLSYALLHFRPMGLHYLAFTGAAQAFWHAEPMYATRFASGAEGYLYSPACAAFFYSLFAFFPANIGRSIYMLVSLLFLAWSIGFLRTTYRSIFGGDIDDNHAGQLFWFMLSSELTGAILAEKLEIAILGVFFFSTALVWQRRFVLPAALLAVVAAFKFQSLPMLGLLFLVFLRERSVFRPALTAAVVFLSLFFAPFLFQDANYLWGQLHLWQVTLSEFMRQAWMAPIFHHVFGFLVKNFAVPISYDLAQGLSAVAGGGFAVWLAWESFYRRQSLAFCACMAVGLGAAFAVLFSPLSQGTGYILYLPLALLLLVQRQSNGKKDPTLFWVLLVGYFFASLCVSDLTPNPLRSWFYSHSFKALGPLILLAYFGWKTHEPKNVR